MAPSLPASGNIVIVKKSGEDGSKYPVVAGSIVIGRGSECDIKILLKDVSIVQCTISTYKNFATITNISEEFTTIVNNESIDSKVLQHGDVITLSNRNFRWEYLRPNAVRTKIPVKSIANKKKMPSFPASILNKKKSTNVTGSRRSEIVPKKVDPQVKRLIESRGRLSLSDLPVKTRQSDSALPMNLMLASPEEKVRKIAVVKPQRRSAEVDATNLPNVSGPGGDNAVHLQTKLDRRSSVTKPRLATKPHRGQSLSPLKSYTGKSKAAKKRESLPADVNKLRVDRKTLKAESRSVGKRMASLKKQHEFTSSDLKDIENIEKVVEPTTIDEHKKAALMLLTGRSPVKKPTLLVPMGVKTLQTKTHGKVLLKNTPKPVAVKAAAPKSEKKSVQKVIRPIIDTPRPKNIPLLSSTAKRVASVVKSTPNVIKNTSSVAKSTPAPRSSVKRSVVQVGIKKSPKKGLFQTPSSRSAIPKAAKTEKKSPRSTVKKSVHISEDEDGVVIGAKLRSPNRSSSNLSAFEASTSKGLKSALKSPDSKRRSDKIKFDLSNLEESSPDKRKSTRATIQSPVPTTSKTSPLPKTPQARKSVHSTPHPNTGQRVNYIRKKDNEVSLPLFNLSDSEYDLESLSDIEPVEMVAKNSTFSINKSSNSSLYNTADSGRISRQSSAASQKRRTTDITSPSSKLRRISSSPVLKSSQPQAVLMLNVDDISVKRSPVPSKLKGGRVSKTPRLAKVVDDSLSGIGSSLDESGIHFLPSPSKTTPDTSTKTNKKKVNSTKKTPIRKSFRSPKLSLGDLFDVLKTSIDSKKNVKSTPRKSNATLDTSLLNEDNRTLDPRAGRTSRSLENVSVSDLDLSTQIGSSGKKIIASSSTINKSQSNTPEVSFSSNHSSADILKSSNSPKLTLSIVHSRTPPNKTLSSLDDSFSSTISKATASKSIESIKDVTFNKTTPLNVSNTNMPTSSRHMRSTNVFEGPALLMPAGRTPRSVQSHEVSTTQSPLEVINLEDMQITTPSISILFEPKSSTPKPNKRSYQKTIKHFEFLSTPEINHKKYERNTIGDRVPKRKSQSIGNLLIPQSESKARRGGIQKTSLKRSQGSINLYAVPTALNTSRRSNRSSDLSSNVSNVTDVNAPRPDNEVIITPKSSLKLLPELVKEKHSTAKKNRVSRKSFIDHMNESKDIVKQLFTIPVKRKLSQSIGHFDTSDLVDDTELNLSIAGINQSTEERDSRHRKSANVFFDLDSVKTTLISPEALDSPLANSIANLSEVNQVSSRNDLSNVSGVNTTKPVSKRASKVSVGNASRKPTPKSAAKQQSKLKIMSDDSNDVRYMFPTPPQVLNSVTNRTQLAQKSPEAQSVYSKSPQKRQKPPHNDLTNISGISALLKTPRATHKSPVNSLTDVSGVKRLLKTPNAKAMSPHNDLTNVSGVKKLLKTPKAVKSPKNDLSNFQGVKRLLKTPGNQPKSPHNDLTNVSGLKRLLKTPRVPPKSPKNDLTNVQGVKQLLKSPARVQKSPHNDLTNIVGLNQLFKSPRRKPNSPRNDLTDLRGVRNLLKTPGRSTRSPRNDLSNVSGLRRLLKTPKAVQTPTNAQSNSPRSPSKSPINVSVTKTVNNSMFDSLLDKPVIRTYERKSDAASKNSTFMISLQENLTYYNQSTLNLSAKRKYNESNSPSAKKQKINPSPTSEGTPKPKNELDKLFIDMQHNMSVGSRSRASRNQSITKPRTPKSGSVQQLLKVSIKENDNSLPIKKRILLRTNNILGHSTPLRNEISIDKKGLEHSTVLSPITYDSVENDQTSTGNVAKTRKHGKPSRAQPISPRDRSRGSNVSHHIEESARLMTRGQNAKPIDSLSINDQKSNIDKDGSFLKKVTFAKNLTLAEEFIEQAVQKPKGRSKRVVKQGTVPSNDARSPVKLRRGRKAGPPKQQNNIVDTASTKSRRKAIFAASPVPLVTSGRRNKAGAKVTSPKSPKYLRKSKALKDNAPQPASLEKSIRKLKSPVKVSSRMEKEPTRRGAKLLSSPGPVLKTLSPKKLATRGRSKISQNVKASSPKEKKLLLANKPKSKSRAAKVASPKLVISKKGKLNKTPTPKKSSTRSRAVKPSAAVAEASPKGRSKFIQKLKTPSPVKPASRGRTRKLASPKVVSPRKGRSKAVDSQIEKSTPKGRSKVAVIVKLPSPVKPASRGRPKRNLSAVSPKKRTSKAVTSVKESTPKSRSKSSVTEKLPSPVKATSRRKLKLHSPKFTSPKFTSPKKSTRGKGKLLINPSVQNPKMSPKPKTGGKRTKPVTSTAGAKKERIEPPASEEQMKSPAKKSAAKRGKGVTKKTKAPIKPKASAKNVSLNKSPVAVKTTRSTRRRNQS